VASPPTGTVTFLFTDIQGSTRLWERDAQRMKSTLARHDEILEGVIVAHDGYVFKMVGDACCAAFSSAPKALEAALWAQRTISKEPWDEECRIRVRMALNTGEAEERDGDYFGPPLNRVARLLSSGHGGQTLLSRTTREGVGGQRPDGVNLEDMGEHRLKDLKEPEHIFQLLAPDLPSEFPPLKTLEAPSEDDRYRLIRQIGSGGMAEVYLAYDEVLEREVAFKVLDRKHAQNTEAVERFRREARSAASLSHDPNIVAIHDRGKTQNGTYYIVMEYLEGGTLEDLIEREGPLSPQRATSVALQVARALSVAHEEGVIHRDIKPQNILLTKTGEAEVADFGIARAQAATTMTQAGSVMGTVRYISPEQALGEPATPKSDLYSLGMVLYEMLTGELPYDAETPGAIVMEHVGGLSRSPKVANPKVPDELDAVTVRLLSKDPDDRHADAPALVEDLGRVEAGLAPVAETMRAGMRARRAGRLRRRGVLVALALLVVVAGVVGVVAVNGSGRSAGNAPVRTLPSSAKSPLKPGEYRTDEFTPSFSFAVDEGWITVGPQLYDALEMEPAGAEGHRRPPILGFYTPQRVADPRDPTGNYVLGPPDSVDGWVTWLQEHPNLEPGKLLPVTVGGKSGVRIDTVVSSVPKGQPARFWVLSDGTTIQAVKGDRMRTFILNVGGWTVLIAIRASGDQFKGFLPKAQKVVNSVDWKSE
jgi:class 3 adenylate cyclase/tRNA A-37 threonylcarbamoyl transferase component Bud32